MSEAIPAQAAKPGYLLTLTWFPDSAVGGVNQAILNLARVITERQRWNPYLLVTSDISVPKLHPQLVCPADSIYLRSPDLPPQHPLRGFVSFLVHLPGALRTLLHRLHSWNVKLVSCHFPDTDSFHFALLRWLGFYHGKFVLSFHGEDIRVLARKNRLGQWAARWMIRHADAVIACSRGLMHDLTAFEPRCAGRATVIYNAIDIDAFRSRIDYSFQLPDVLEDRPFLLNVARYEHKKGQDILLRAFEKLAPQFPKLMLVTIGTSVGDESAAVRALVDKSPVRDRILMLENIPHARIGVFLKAASLFVLPSRREGFPFVLLEAGAMQTAVVAAACLGVPEIIEDGVTGRLSPVEDADAFASAISDLLNNDDTRRRLAQNLHDVVAGQFSWEAIYQQHIALAEDPVVKPA